MSKHRSAEPWMPAPAYARTLSGLTVNLIVRSVEPAVAFAREVLGAEVVYADPDFALLRHGEAEWMLHADHTYDHHPLHPALASGERRGLAAELRLHGRDPDAAERAARERGDPVVEPATDKPHGLREAFIVDPDGYLWVPDVPT